MEKMCVVVGTTSSEGFTVFSDKFEIAIIGYRSAVSDLELYTVRRKEAAYLL